MKDRELWQHWAIFRPFPSVGHPNKTVFLHNIPPLQKISWNFFIKKCFFFLIKASLIKQFGSSVIVKIIHLANLTCTGTVTAWDFRWQRLQFLPLRSDFHNIFPYSSLSALRAGFEPKYYIIHSLRSTKSCCIMGCMVRSAHLNLKLIYFACLLFFWERSWVSWP